MPAPTLRMYPARERRTWLTLVASAGASFMVGMSAREKSMERLARNSTDGRMAASLRRPARGGPSRRAAARASAGLVVLAVALVHARSLAFGFTGLDDRDLVVGDQAFLARPGSLLRVFGRSYLHIVD